MAKSSERTARASVPTSRHASPFFRSGDSRPAFFQPKLTVNTPGDQLEQEADRTADRVMAAPARHAPERGFFAGAPRQVQREPDDQTGKVLSEGLTLAYEQANDQPGFEEWKEEQTASLKYRLWENQPTELKAGLIGFGLSSAGILGTTLALDPRARRAAIDTLQDTNILLPLSLLPHSEYFPLSGFKYKLPTAAGAPYTFQTEFDFDAWFKLAREKWPIPKVGLTVGVDSAYGEQTGFSPLTGGSIKLKFGGGIVNLSGFYNNPLPPTPMLISDPTRGESPVWLMRSLPGQMESNLPRGSGVFLTVDVLRLPDLFKPDVPKRDAAVQRKDGASAEASGQGGVATPAVSGELQSGTTEALPDSVRAFMEPRFDRDLSDVRIHRSQQAAESAASINARAYTSGNDIVFNSGEYQPHTPSGQRLLAHELTHTLQQTGGVRRQTPSIQLKCEHCEKEERVQRQVEDDLPDEQVLAEAGSDIQRAPDEPQAQPTAIGFTVALDGLTLSIPDTVSYKPGPKAPQIVAILLQYLLGDQYKPGLEREASALLGKYRFERSGGMATGAIAKGGETIGPSSFALQPTMLLIDWLRTVKKLKLQLTEAQEGILTLGVASANLWADFVASLKEANLPLPGWYTRDIFTREMAQHGAILHEYGAQLSIFRQGEKAEQAAASTAITRSIGNVTDALYAPAMVLEAVRTDISLAKKPETAGIYGALWQLPKPNKEGEAPKVTTPPTRMRGLGVAVLFLGYMRTQAQLANNAETSADDRFELVRRFALYSQRMMFTSAPGGDEQVRDQPATANAAAFPSTLKPMFQISPPLFDAALGTDHRFAMQIEFLSVYEALGRYAFNWERVRIPDDKIGAPVDVDKLKGERATLGEVASVRFSRDTSYAKADINRAIETMKTELGPAGVGAMELVGANAILRYVGTGIKLFAEVLTMPLDQKSVVFPTPGLYMVRGVMSQVREGNEEIMRAPSVAYFPVLARDPDEMAAGGVSSALTAREKAAARIKAIEARLASPPLADDERAQLQEELAALKLSLSSLGTRLESRRADAAKRVEEIKSGKEQGDLEGAEKDLTTIEGIIALRAKRKANGGEQITARFVSDLGQTIPLMLEVVDKPKTPSQMFQVYVSDVTTPKSGDDTGTGKTREDAIVDAVKQILEGIEGYGRGRVALALAGGVRTIRIDASMGSLLSESIESLSTVLSIAAIAAAPFTAGATLAFLIPLGLVGAIPSAYRIATRLESGTFELDLENALEIVNIAGSLVGLGRMGATSVKMMRLGRGLMIVGFGIDAAGGILMGAQLIIQIDQLSKLPPGERASALMLLIGQTMLSAGVMVGGALAERAQQRHAEANAAKAREAKPGLVDETPAGTKKQSVEPEPSSAHPVEEAPSAAKPASSADAVAEKARVDREMAGLGKMDAESEAKLRNDEPLRKALNESPLAAAALKKCASPCYPKNASPEQVAALDKILSRLAKSGPYDEAALKTFLHDNRDDLNTAIARLERVQSGKQLGLYIDYFETFGDIKDLPSRGTPDELRARINRAHDVGVERGRARGKADGLEGVGFANPIKDGSHGQGLDDVMRKGPNLDTGEVYVVEYKGGTSKLAKGQMELDWIVGNIRRLYTQGGLDGQQWARSLAKALSEGRLRGVAYSTPLVGNAPQPTKTVKTWTYPATPLKLL